MDSMEITGGHNVLSERTITFESPETIVNNGFSDFYTGYYDQSGWEIRQQRNEEQCILYKLPREIVLGIIHHLVPMDIYRLRHTSRGFLQLISVKDFGTVLELTSAQQLQQLMQAVLSAPNIPPRFSQPVLFRPSFDELVEIKELRRTELLCQMCSENRGRPVVGGAAYDLRQHCLGLSPETREDYHHRLYSMEARNNAFWRALYRSEHPPRLRPYCYGCETGHDLAYFSSDQLSPDTDHRICIGHEGKLKLCSHVQISWAELWTHVATYNSEEPGWETIKAIFQRSPFSDCPACAQRVGQHGKAPAIIYAPKKLQHRYTPGDSFLNFELGWKLVVLNLREGEVVTKELLRHALSRLQESFGDFCCPHLLFTDTAFMAPFSWHQCVCFREAGSVAHAMLHIIPISEESSWHTAHFHICPEVPRMWLAVKPVTLNTFGDWKSLELL
ncbi:hypothetical protein CSIM01_05210 [Colletotrichum simmondsii]|uniref:F-box domain-containing protein n=1 Tax=Colletotrichum simmondsii TaxID=703756 RepID=A0A135SAY4_9PEZI|nr:hypothetical protein CSIM01_05210 [Colletotrichum simmondsii]